MRTINVLKVGYLVLLKLRVMLYCCCICVLRLESSVLQILVTKKIFCVNMWKFELLIQANVCVSLKQLKWLSCRYLQYKTYIKTHTFNDLHQGSIELTRSWDKPFKSTQQVKLLSFALLAETILKLFPDLLNGSIFTLVHTYQFFPYGQMLELTFKAIHFLMLRLFVPNLQKSLLNCAPSTLSSLLTLSIIDTRLRAFAPYRPLIRACTPLLSPLSTLCVFLCLVSCVVMFQK